MPTLRARNVLTASLLSLCIYAGSYQVRAAENLPDPTGETILTVSGGIENTNDGETAVFDRQMLESLGTTSFTTMTPWYDQPVTFEGVRLDKLMELVGAKGATVKAVALNDYSTDIPLTDFAAHGAMLALKRDGNYMPVRDKGPLFIVYPYDSDTALQSQTYYGRSAWQLSKLIVE